MIVQMSLVQTMEHVEIMMVVFGVNVVPVTLGNFVKMVRVFLFDRLES